MNDAIKSRLSEEINALIIDELKKGVCPWRKQWKNGCPRNAATNRPYSGFNALLLAFKTAKMGWSSSRFLTYKQAADIGGFVKAGEKASSVYYWKFLKVKDKETKEEKEIPFLRYYAVFNADQCEGLNLKADELDQNRDDKKADAEKLILSYLDREKINARTGEMAFYTPMSDEITMPSFTRFENAPAYYSTFFHEMAHSTGHEKRLNRKEVAGEIKFGSEPYSREELTAELASAYLCRAAGIDNDIKMTAAYLEGWAKHLADKPELFLTASSRAEKAALFVIDGAAKEEAKPQEESAVIIDSVKVVAA